MEGYKLMKSKISIKRICVAILGVALLTTAVVPYIGRKEAKADVVTVKGTNRWTYDGHTRYEWRGTDGLKYFCSEPGQRNSNPGIKTEYSLTNPYANNPYLHCQIAAAGYALNQNQVTYQQAQIYVWNVRRSK